MKFEIDQFFKGTYPPEAAVWCMQNNAHLEPKNGGWVIVKNKEKELA